MALRDLVMGGGGCAVPGTSSTANPLGSLAESLFGSASKTQERLKELPSLPGLDESVSSELATNGPLGSLPGSEFEQYEHSGYVDAWTEANGPQMPLPPILQDRVPVAPDFTDFDRIYEQQVPPRQHPAIMDGTPQRVLSGFLHSFLHSGRSEVPFHFVHLPELGLSSIDKQRIRDRSSIMARHLFAEKGDTYVNEQINAFLHSLDIDAALGPPQGQRFLELEEYWNEVHARGSGFKEGVFPSDQWALEFKREQIASHGVESWVNEFQRQQRDNWVHQFSEDQSQIITNGYRRSTEANTVATLEQTRSLVDTLSQNQDPKFQNSKFLQFVSKMSRGELIVEDNQLKPNKDQNANVWANEFQQQQPGERWAAEFTAGEHIHRGDTWADEYQQSQNLETSLVDKWADEFSKMNLQEWADEFKDQDDFHRGWLDDYNNYVEEQLKGEERLPSSSKWVYVFSDQNPYVGHPNPLKEGQDLFRRGLLSEAVLALEAEVLNNPDNAEGWRLLGITHAENDDDRQAIASMVNARDADPANLEVLLALGVSHTNELEQQEALKYLRGWLQHHPMYGSLIPGDQIHGFSHSEVTELFLDAAQRSPEDADVHTVLGVLYNLSRDYNKAIEAFQRALQLKPKDYSLWNKLGATQANSSHSSDAVYAYQEALDLKPNYVRAWTNMGISYANQGLYMDSVRFYVRALCMNPKAESAWQYLKISLSIAGNTDMVDACERRDLDLLQKEFPL